MTRNRRSGSGMLAAGGVAALLASSCCVAPLALVMVGFSGAWIGGLTRMEPYRPFFLLVTVVALAFAALPVFRPAQVCDPADLCARPTWRRTQQVSFVVVLIVFLVALVFPFLAHFFY